MEDKHSTSVIGFKGPGFVVVGTESRRLYASYGDVYDNDSFKIQHICHKVFGIGAGSTNMIDKVWEETINACLLNLPNTVKEVAELVSRVAQRNINPKRICSSFVVFGWITGPCDMYTVMPYVKTAPLEKPPSKNADEDDMETNAERKSVKRKDREVEEVEDAEEVEKSQEVKSYEAREANEVLLGSGKTLMRSYLDEDCETYPLTADTTLEDAKKVIKDAMCSPLNHDFCADGKLRAVSVSEGGIVGYSYAEIVDPGGRQEKYYGGWIEGDLARFGL